MMIKAIIFDLDGTLIPMNEGEFTNGYFELLCKKLVPFGYDKNKLVETVWAGTKAMIKNDGKTSNDKVFWKVFADAFGEDKLKDKVLFDEFYETDFHKTKTFCGQNPLAKQIVQTAKRKGFKVILASNPVFPKKAMLVRAGFVGLCEDDFDYITNYENCSYSKPNPNFFTEILNANNLEPQEVIVFGNSETEDIKPATFAGIKAYLVTDFLSEKPASSNATTLSDAIKLIETL